MSAPDAIRSQMQIGSDVICYVKAGVGPPLIFVHGWALDHRCWNSQIDFFSRQFTVIAYDCLGIGCSTGGKTPYPFQILVEQLEGVITGLCEGPPVIVGHSLGGSIALQYAAEHSNQVAALVNVASSLPFPQEQQQEATMFIAAVNKYGLEATVNHVCEMLWTETFRAAHAEVISDWQAQYTSLSTTSLANSLTAWAERPSPQDLLNMITVPTQHVIGAVDACKSVNSLEQLSRLIPGSVINVIPETGHMSFVEKPEEFNSLVARFLASSSATML